MVFTVNQYDMRNEYRGDMSDLTIKITEVHPNANYTLQIVADDGRIGTSDVSPYFEYETFADLKNQSEFIQVSNGGYFIEWDCGVDLSADTIEARWQISAHKNGMPG